MSKERAVKCPHLREAGVCDTTGDLPQYAMQRVKPVEGMLRIRVCTAVPDAERVEECRGNPILYLSPKAGARRNKR